MVTIRQIRAEDKESFHNLVRENTARLVDYFPITVENAASLEIAGDTIRMYNMLAEKNELLVLVVQKNSDEKVVGMVFLKNIDHKTGKCELAYFVDKHEEGKGFTSYAIKQSVDIAFNTLNLNKVYCRVAPDNEPSKRVVQKNGFELEGVLKQEFKLQDGSLIDLHYYGLLKN